MESMLFAIAIAIFFYVGFMMIMPKSWQAPVNTYTRRALDRIYAEVGSAENQQSQSIDNDDTPDSPLWDMLVSLPFSKPLLARLLEAGIPQHLGRILLVMFAIFCVGMVFTIRAKLGLIGFTLSLAAAYILPFWWLGKRITKRNEKFLNLFPDALDMIVRSVRTGYPMNAALRVVAENMDNPIRDEFQQVVDEVAYGRSMPEALERLALRVDQQDVRFFIIVLAVQLETGGNLTEILQNLSTVIRARRQLRLKIKALTAEGRVTGWVLGALPVFLFGVLSAISPQHIAPFFNSPTGHIALGIAIGLIATAGLIVKSMIDIEV